MPLDPLSNEDKKNTYIGGSTPADYSTDPYRNAPDIKDIPKKMGQALGKSIYNMINGSRTPTPSTPPSTYDDQSIPGAPTSIRGNNNVGADWGDGSQYTSGATYNTNGQQQNPYEMINEDNPFISGSLRTKQPTNPDEMPITYTQDEWGDTKATIMDQQGGVGSISYEGGPRSKGGSVSYTNMFSNALKEQQAKEAAAAVAQQQAAPASSVRSRIDALQKQLDKSRSIFDRRGHTLQEYRKAAALRKDLRQQIQDLQGVEQQEMRGQQAMDLATLQGQFGLQEANISNANQNKFTWKDAYNIAKDERTANRQAEQDAIAAQDRQETKDQKNRDSVNEVTQRLTSAATPEEKDIAIQDMLNAYGNRLYGDFQNADAEQRTALLNSPEGRALAYAIKSGLQDPMNAEADTIQLYEDGQVFPPSENFPLGQINNPDLSGWQQGKGNWIADNPIFGKNDVISYVGNDSVSGPTNSSAYLDNLTPTQKILAQYANAIGDFQRKMKQSSVRDQQGK
jgi:hypothetical protein